MAGATDREADIFAKFIVSQTIVIADESASARSGAAHLLSQLGAKPHQMALANTFAAAKDEILARKPTIVLAEYEFGKSSCGLELIQAVKVASPDFKKSLFILMTGNSSQTAVARAAEEDVDAFVLKPILPDSFRKTLIRTALLKIHPPKYIQEIEKGKELMASGDVDGAENCFKQARHLDPKPSLALYYLGQCQFMRNLLDDAQGNYAEGLAFNRIHYKCMVGLYELLMDIKAHDKAYEVVKKLSQYFPANPKRLTEVLRLAIINKQYDDVERYYAIYRNIDEPNDVLLNYVCAALVVCAKYYLMTGNRSRALELCVKAAMTSAGRTKVPREIILSLLEFKMPQEAQKFLEYFSIEQRLEADFQLLEFQVLHALPDTRADAVMTRGQDLLAKGIEDERIYEILILRSIESSSPEMAEHWMQQAVIRYPELQTHFERLGKII